ncbi:response regulator transcription factor [Aquabacterium sp.]|uniref:response regulator transcription factor n=1 Tax=Aquabacterium sp. TaxID=1872578 RepID=UPI002B7F76A1|nr:response regulator transcription factor [Aquabacterium sp.]HSW04905.1 response regulator transcription factor [Aquabacterium sp.]
MRILLIEDNAELVLTLRQSLAALGIAAEACGDGHQADALLREHAFDIVVLDLALPGLSGLQLLRRLRERGDSVPVLVLTASGDTHDRVLGLNAGADDYLPKPFDLAELEARLRALYRRRLGAVHAVVQVGGLAFDTLSRRFSVSGRHIDLPPREHDLLESLMAHPGRPVSKLALAQRLCSADAVLSHDALEVYVHRLRRRLDGSGAAIHTLRGLGYVLEADDAPA